MAYWGMDTNLNDPSLVWPCGKNFYIGRIGWGTTADLSYFSSTLSGDVGAANTYAYWQLQGPGTTPSGQTPFEYGQAQGNACLNQWTAMYNAGEVKRLTVFADVEPNGAVGWYYNPSSSQQTANQDVLNGFLSVFPTHDRGLYCASGTWTNYFGSVTAANYYIQVAWSYDNASATFSSCPTTFSVPQIGGLTPTIWQFVAATDQYHNDFDMATSLPQ